MRFCKHLMLFLIFNTVVLSYAQVIPHPLKKHTISDNLLSNQIKNLNTSDFYNAKRNKDLTNNILVLRVAFPNLDFVGDEVFPTFHPHNYEYFDKYLQHLKNYYLDASHGQYELNYDISSDVYVADNNYEWYGDDENESLRRVLLVDEIINKADSGIDFSQYEAIIVFHSGAGQETDINNTQTNSLWSTFMSVGTFNYYLAPEDENYQGILTQDNSYITKVAFLPEWEFHQDFPEDENYSFDILGVLANQYGRILDLPSLHDNVSENGSSAGVGNFDIMGTGMWNNNGKIPCLPSAWTRYFAGWEVPVLIKGNQEDIKISYPMSNYTAEDVNKLYKVEISEKEYFLIENRQQNFIRDFVEYDGQVVEFALHSFELLPEEEQDYYPGLPYNIPIVNLMNNNLRGSEWDYFLPYYVDESYNFYGPGLLIWHIDENIIENKIEDNTINGNALHKGVDLEEADGIQHMDSAMPDNYMRGGPYDSFRVGNNTYFGKQINPETGFFSSPDASSYYGGTNFEIYNISESDTIMTFSVKFDPWCQANFHSENFLEPFVYDYNNDGVDEVHFIGSDGFLSIFENNELIHNIEIESDTIAFNYTFNDNDKLVIPTQDKFYNIEAKLYAWNGNVSNNPFPSADLVWQGADLVWAGSVVYIDDEWEYEGSYIKWILPLNTDDGLETKIYFLDDDFNEITCISLDYAIISNFIYNDCNLSFFSLPITYSKPTLLNFDEQLDRRETYFLNDEELHSNNIETAFTSEYLLNNHEIFVWEKTDKPLNNNFYLFNFNSHVIQKIDIDFPYSLTGSPILADVNNNGNPDLILSHANGFEAYSLKGSLLKSIEIDFIDDVDNGSGVIAWDINNDGNNYYLGTFSGNRFKVFDSQFNELKNYSRTFSRSVKTKSYISSNDTEVSFYQATDEGRIYEFKLDFVNVDHLENLTWSLQNINYFRNSYWKDKLVNQFNNSEEIFVSKQNYLYPNPWIKRHHSQLKFNIMTSKDTEVEILIYDISGHLIAKKIDQTEAYVSDLKKFCFNPEKWSSGIYFAIVKSEGKEIKLKFGIEK
ncbi:MAG: T9SS type A sorting domain-containing protein [Candidatus Cloacimonetes bacterium]|nr:T9SS type A sorting domain-containing protein [Candidatus Cloacimonadota bacterium]